MLKIEALAGPVVLCEEEKQRLAFRKLMHRTVMFWAKRRLSPSGNIYADKPKRNVRINRKAAGYLCAGFVAELGCEESNALLDWSIGKRRN